MTNKSSVWCTIMGILGYIFGIGFCFTLILIPVAIYCFIGAKKYIEWSAVSDSELASQKKSLTSWAIFFSIVGFPFGLLSIVPVALCSNNVVVTNASEPNEGNKENSEAQEKETKTDSVENRMETIAKLESLKKEGLITEEEFERAKKEVLENKK